MDHVMCTFYAGAANWESLGGNWPLRLGDAKSSPVGCIGPSHVLLTESNPHDQPRLTHAKTTHRTLTTCARVAGSRPQQRSIYAQPGDSLKRTGLESTTPADHTSKMSMASL